MPMGIRSNDEAPPILAMTAEIVASYVGYNALPAAALPGLIRAVYRSLSDIADSSDELEYVSPDRTIASLDSLLRDSPISPHGADCFHKDVPDDWLSLPDEERHERFFDAARRFVPGLASNRGLGGYGCLATMSRRKSAQVGRVAVYSPEALGLLHIDDDRLRRGAHDHVPSLYELVAQGKIDLQSIKGYGLDAPDSIRIEINNPGFSTLRARIDFGTVFEQRFTPNVQNLMVGRSIETPIKPGKNDLQARGMRMDSGASTPDGEEMLLTPWILRIRPEGLDQDVLWRVT